MTAAADREERAYQNRSRRRAEQARQRRERRRARTAGFLAAAAPDVWAIPEKVDERVKKRPGGAALGTKGTYDVDKERLDALAAAERIKKKALAEGRDLTFAETEQVIRYNKAAVQAGHGHVSWELGERALEQIASAFLYTPAGLYQLAKDPKGTLSAIPGAIAEDFRHPGENPGYLLMDVLGVSGLLRSGASKAARVAKAKSAREAAKAAVTPPPVGLKEIAPGALVPNPRGIPHPIRATDSAVGRARVKTRRIVAAIDTADASALRDQARRLPKPVGEAIRAAAENTPLADRIAMYRRALNESKLTAYKRRRIRERIAAAEEAQKRGYLVDDGAKVTISDRFPEIQELYAAARVESDKLTGLKIELGLLDPEDAAGRINKPGEIFSGGRFYSRQDAAKDAAKARRAAQTEIAAAEWRARPGFPTPAAAARIDDLKATTARAESEAQAAAEAAQESAGTIVGGGGRQGDFYLPGHAEKAPSLGPVRFGGHSVGVPRNPFSRKPYTGEATRHALTDPNPVKALAESSLAAERLRLRHEIWGQAKQESITAEQLVRQLRDGAVDAAEVQKHWRAVRLRPGTSTLETRAVVDNMFQGDNLFGGKLDLDALQDLARDADAAAQVRFFDNRRIRADTAQLRHDTTALGHAADVLNSLAKISLLPAAGTAYLLPNLMGQTMFALIQQGLRAPLEVMGRAPLIVRQLNGRQKARLRAGSGYGIAESIAYERGPRGTVQWASDKIGKAFGAVLDRPWRDASFVYEAWLKGYTDAPSIKRLLDARKGSAEHLDLIEISMRVDRAFGDFRNMTGFEQLFVRRLVFFWPWIRASGEYAILRAPADHPVAVAALTQIGRTELARQELMFGEAMLRYMSLDTPDDKEAVRRLGREAMKLLPPGTFMTGDRDNAGRGPRVISPRAAAILEGPSEAYDLISGSEPLKKLAQMVTPAVGLTLTGLGYDSFRGDGYPASAGNMWSRIAQEATGLSRWPNFAWQLGNPGLQENRVFAYTGQDPWRRALGGSQMPKTLNERVLAERVSDERRQSSSRVKANPTRAETARQRMAVERRHARFVFDAREIPESDWPQIEALLDTKEKLDVELARLGDDPTYRDRALAAARVFKAVYPDVDRSSLNKTLAQAGSSKEYEVIYHKLREILLDNYYKWARIADETPATWDMGWVGR